MGPWRRISPFSRRARGRRRLREVRFCSESSTAMPSFFRRRSSRAISSTITGATLPRARPAARLRIAHQRAGDREHLLLAAAIWLPGGRASRRDWGTSRRVVPSTPAARAARAWRHLQVLAHAEVGEDAPVFRHPAQAQPGDAIRRQRRDVGAAKAMGPRRRGISPMIAFIVVDLPAPFLPTRATHSPGATARSTPNRICAWPYQASRDVTSSIPIQNILAAGLRRIVGTQPVRDTACAVRRGPLSSRRSTSSRCSRRLRSAARALQRSRCRPRCFRRSARLGGRSARRRPGAAAAPSRS